MADTRKQNGVPIHYYERIITIQYTTIRQMSPVNGLIHSDREICTLFRRCFECLKSDRIRHRIKYSISTLDITSVP